MKKHIVARVIGGIVIVASFVANICLWKENDSLKNSIDRHISMYNDSTAKSDDLQSNLDDLQSNFDDLSREYNILQIVNDVLEEENTLFRENTLAVAKERAKELGYNPNELDWFLSNNGHWCFFDYSDLDE